MVMNEQEIEKWVFELGQWAYNNGVWLIDNPFIPQHKFWEIWRSGYKNAILKEQ